MIGTVTRGLWRVNAAASTRSTDCLAVEEPMEIRVNERGYAITMRTPGHDLELATGFCVSEGLISGNGDLLDVHAMDGNGGDVVNVLIAGPGTLVAMDRHRNTYTTSSCGVCGLASIEAVATTSRFQLTGDRTVVDASQIVAMPKRLMAAQSIFASTGGVHAAGLFTANGERVLTREDVGRHNAVDKVVGWAVSAGRLPLTGHVLQLSGRASFELVQKAAMAGISVVAAVSAPSSLAVKLAESLGITLIGFSRGGAFNVYSRPDRVAR